MPHDVISSVTFARSERFVLVRVLSAFAVALKAYRKGAKSTKEHEGSFLDAAAVLALSYGVGFLI